VSSSILISVETEGCKILEDALHRWIEQGPWGLIHSKKPAWNEFMIDAYGAGAFSHESSTSINVNIDCQAGPDQRVCLHGL